MHSLTPSRREHLVDNSFVVVPGTEYAGMAEAYEGIKMDEWPVFVELEREGRRARYWGAVFSYYEFKHPMDDRLTDEAWQAMSPKPARPPWTSAFVAESNWVVRWLHTPRPNTPSPNPQPTRRNT